MRNWERLHVVTKRGSRLSLCAGLGHCTVQRFAEHSVGAGRNRRRNRGFIVWLLRRLGLLGTTHFPVYTFIYSQREL